VSERRAAEERLVELAENVIDRHRVALDAERDLTAAIEEMRHGLLRLRVAEGREGIARRPAAVMGVPPGG
jgi:hypothetical protein